MRFNGYSEIQKVDNMLSVDMVNHKYTCGFFDVYDRENKRTKIQFKNPPTVSYRTGKDNSGGIYELIEFSDWSDSWYSDTIIGKNRLEHTHVQIQTWNRKEIFISFWYQHKRWHGYRATSDHNSCIIDLNPESSSRFAAWIEDLIANRV